MPNPNEQNQAKIDATELAAKKDSLLNSASFLQVTSRSPEAAKSNAILNQVPDIRTHFFEVEALDIISENYHKSDEEITNELINSWKNHIALAHITDLFQNYSKHLREEEEPSKNKQESSNSRNVDLNTFQIGDPVGLAEKAYATNLILGFVGGNYSFSNEESAPQNANEAPKAKKSAVRLKDLGDYIRTENGQKIIHILPANRDTKGDKILKSLVNILTLGVIALYHKKWFWQTDGDVVAKGLEKAMAEPYVRMNPSPRAKSK